METHPPLPPPRSDLPRERPGHPGRPPAPVWPSDRGAGRPEETRRSR
jgi:hypothetical protein